MLTYPADFPSTNLPFRGIKDEEMQASFRSLLSLIEQMRARLAIVLNNNTVQYVSQNDEPTLDDGRWTIWKDADAASGQPSHYLLYNDGGTTVKWTSSTLVP